MDHIFPLTIRPIFEDLEDSPRKKSTQEEEKFFNDFHVCESPDNVLGEKYISNPDPDGITNLSNNTNSSHLTFNVNDIDL